MMRLSRKSLNIAALVLFASFLLGGCTAVRVQPVGAEHKISHICINDNARVLVGDFVDVMQEGFQKHGITSQVITGTPPSNCTYTSDYTARRTWDIAMYMTDAQIDILRDGLQIASANYHLKGGGGFSLNKWDGTRTKILPVIDQLFAQLTPSNGLMETRVYVAPSSGQGAVEGESKMSAQPSALTQRLSHLKDAFDAGLITRDEYEAKRKELIASF